MLVTGNDIVYGLAGQEVGRRLAGIGVLYVCGHFDRDSTV